MPGSGAGYHFMQDFRNCEVRWHYNHVERLEPLLESPSTLYGDGMHHGLAGYYRAFQAKEPVHRRVEQGLNDFMVKSLRNRAKYQLDSIWEKDHERGQEVLRLYGMHYPVENFQVVAIEQDLKMTTKLGFTITGRIDLAVLYDNGRMRIRDHKTTGWSLQNLKKTLGVSGQATCYIALWNATHPDRPINQIEFNILRNYQGSTDFDQFVVMKSQDDIDQFILEADHTMQMISQRVADPNAIWVHNYDSCFKFNRQCPYIDLCRGSNYRTLVGSHFRIREEDEEEAENGDS